MVPSPAAPAMVAALWLAAAPAARLAALGLVALAVLPFVVVATQVIFHIARVAVMKDRDKNSKAERNGLMNDSNSTKE